MKYYKRIILISFLLALFIISVSYAHPGRTDANGGHYDNSTGEYHYHHGYPAHQHPNGVCPYSYNTDSSTPTFDDKEKEDMYNRIIANYEEDKRQKEETYNRIIANHEEYLDANNDITTTNNYKQDINVDKDIKNNIINYFFEHDSLIFFILFITIDSIVILVDKLKRK